MDNDLERSVRLLEDSLSTPTKGLLNPRIGSQKSLADLQVSLTLAPDEVSNLFKTSNNTQFNETMGSLLQTDNTLRGSVIYAGTPWESTMDNLHMEFAGIVQNHSSGADILEVAADLGRCCSDALTVVQGLKSKVAISCIPEEKLLENERNHWRLLHALYQDRLNSQNSTSEEFDQYVGNSEKLCVNHLFKRDSLIRESQLVIDWLERNALDQDDPILHHSDWTYGWEHTLHQLLAPDSIAIGSNTKTITNIHPDAPQLQNLSLHHLDSDNEKKLCQRVFTEIRCGKLEAAQELCYNCGHPWRAALLEGWKLYHNSKMKEPGVPTDTDNSEPTNLSNIVSNEVTYEDVEGNVSRDLWKAVAIQYCKKNCLNVYEKAAVAALCGYLESLLPVCATWEDNLWAYIRTMVDIRVESEIRDCIVKSYKSLPEEYWEQKMSLNEIFTALESSKNASVRNASLELDHIIQKHIILDKISKLIEILDTWIDDPAVSVHSLRFFTHLILFFDHVGEIPNRESSEKIVGAYIKKLSEANETQLVAFYVSKLRKRKQVIMYAQHLEKIIENDQRRTALGYAEDFGIDVLAVTQRVVEAIRNRPNEIEIGGNLHRKMTEDDEIKISSLDWLTFYEEQRPDALIQTNAMIFTFLTLGKLDAAQLSINKVPANSVDKILNGGEIREDLNQVIKEYLSYKAYLDAQEAFNEWFKQFKNKPIAPAEIHDQAQFTEKVAHQHRVSQYNAEIERWKLTTSQAAKTAKTLLYNVLLFPLGWLEGGEDTDYLRSICIPEVVLLLYSVLSESGCHEEAVQLADLLAAEKHGLYKVYSKEKLGEILEKICESSVALLNAKKDPWGSSGTA